MSLLMDALRKAEEAKRKSADRSQDTDGSPAADPAMASPGAGQTEHSPEDDASRGTSAPLQPAQDVQAYLNERNRRSKTLREQSRQLLEEVDPRQHREQKAESAPVIQDKDDSPRDRSEQRNRQSAATVFSAKKPVRTNRRQAWLFLSVLLCIPVLGAGWWFWVNWQQANQSFISTPVTNSSPGNSGGDGVSSTPQRLPPSQTEVTNPLLDNGAMPPAAEPVAGTAAPLPAETPDNPAETPPAETPGPAGLAAEMAGTGVAEASAETGTTESALTPLTTASASTPEASSDQATGGEPIQLLRSTRSDRGPSPALRQAYEHLQLGNYPQARQNYQQVLDRSPNNRDALLGLAAIARHDNDTITAQRLYTRLLQLDPRDPLAQAGLQDATLNTTSVEAAEQTLLGLLAENPGRAPLQFALGNLYARQQRWKEAESAYFEALVQARRESPETVNPDYAFNLAISLEHINQPAQALEYYRLAETHARVSAASFRPSALNERIRYLEQLLP